MSKKFFKKYSLFALVWTLLTIFWGAWVRLSLSGEGCGKSWPLCHQKLLPESAPALVEWIHRATSGLSLVFVFLLWLFSLQIYPKNHIVRKFSSASFILILIEALIGAFLVLSGLVGLNKDQARVWILALHLINSLLLTGALALSYQTSLWDRFKIKKPLIYWTACFPLLALTGNIASLAGQLFPSSSLISALALDFAPSAHISLRLRPLHPLLAVLFVSLLGAFSVSQKKLRPVAIASGFVALFGFITLLSLSPLGMKISHLILAYALWLFLVYSSVQKLE